MRPDAQDQPRMVILGPGLRAPYPEPTSSAATRTGRSNRSANTKPERVLRSELHRRGRRFRKNFLIRCGPVRVHPDIVFTRARVAVFVDGCFWHSCPEHQVIPKSNREYWTTKFRANAERDRRVNTALIEHGWSVIRSWEHENVDEVADRIEQSIDSR